MDGKRNNYHDNIIRLLVIFKYQPPFRYQTGKRITELTPNLSFLDSSICNRDCVYKRTCTRHLFKLQHFIHHRDRIWYCSGIINQWIEGTFEIFERKPIENSARQPVWQLIHHLWRISFLDLLSFLRLLLGSYPWECHRSSVICWDMVGIYAGIVHWDIPLQYSQHIWYIWLFVIYFFHWEIPHKTQWTILVPHYYSSRSPDSNWWKLKETAPKYSL